LDAELRVSIGTPYPRAFSNGISLSNPAMELALYEDEECIVCADAGCPEADKSSGLQGGKTDWYISKRPSKVSALKRRPLINEVPISIKQMKGSFKAEVEHTCRVIKGQFSATKGHVIELQKSISDLAMLLALGDTVRGGSDGQDLGLVRLNAVKTAQTQS
jgi:hypothetical protein